MKHLAMCWPTLVEKESSGGSVRMLVVCYQCHTCTSDSKLAVSWMSATLMYFTIDHTINISVYIAVNDNTLHNQV